MGFLSALISEQSTHSIQTLLHGSALGIKSFTAIIDVCSGEFYISIQTDDQILTVPVNTGKILYLCRTDLCIDCVLLELKSAVCSKYPQSFSYLPVIRRFYISIQEFHVDEPSSVQNILCVMIDLEKLAEMLKDGNQYSVTL